MNPQQKLAIQALESMKGDNLARARHAFKDCTPAEMNAEYGQSGRTPAQIIASYEEHNAKVDAAIEWVKNAK
jgi:hypothetical protein